MQHMSATSISTDFVPVDTPRGGAIAGFLVVLAFYAVVGLVVAGFVFA